MRALITGSSGLLGSAVAEQFHNDDAYSRVTGIDLVPGLYTNWQIDVRDFCRSSVAVHGGFDVAVHCAATVGGRAVLEQQSLAHAQNIELDAAFVAWAERALVKFPLYVSSCAVYPYWLTAVREPLKEADRRFPVNETYTGSGPWLPDRTYGFAKLTGEYLASITGCAVARPFAFYGPGQRSGHPLVSFTAQAAAGGPITVWGDGKQLRDFTHVTDVARAIKAMVDNDIRGPVNIATGRAITLNGAATLCGRAAGYDPVVVPDPAKPAGPASYLADITRLLEFYEPRIRLEDGLAGMRRVLLETQDA